ncbi:MAG TPA: hypothetical protein VLB44_03115 [Kofleriaceae bacterium]|nr:hypothetical protein [Kofleriaceae bacterium]
MSGRVAILVPALLWGLALGLVAYRFGVLPLILESRLTWLIPGLSVGLFMGGLQLFRQRPKRTRRSEPFPLMPMLGVGGAGFAMSFGIMYVAFPSLSRTPLTKRALPGFSLALPAGESTEQLGYPTGNVILKRVGDGTGVVMVQWEPGGAMTPEELQMIAPIAAKAITNEHGKAKVTTIVGPGKKPTDTIVFDTDTVDMELSMLTCGVRHVLIASAAHTDLAPLHQRIVSSFECKPDPAQEATAHELPFPLALDLPGWHLVASDGEVTQISSDNASLVLRTLPAMLAAPELTSFVGPAFEQAGAHVTIVDQQKDFLKVRLEQGSDSGAGWVGMFHCPTGIALVLGLANDDTVAMDVYNRVKATRCVKPGEPPTTWPESR